MLNEEDNNNYSRQCPGPKRLGVTFLASEWGSRKGGLSTLNRELAINIAKDPRIKVSYFVPSCNDEDKTAAHSHKIELIKAPRRPGLDELEWLNFPPKDLQIDVVVGHDVKLGHQAQIIREFHECKWIQVVHTDPEELGIYKEYPNPISNAQKKHKTEVELCELADFVVPVGPKLYKAFHSYLASCKKEQCFFQFTPGILAEFSELKQSPEKREVCKVLCFGRGDSEDFKLKGFDIAARAVAKLSHCILLFVGAAKDKLEETRTRFLDFDIPPSQLRVRAFLDSREDLKKVFCEADLVVMPSRTEGFGLTGLEALSAGLPILVSRKSGFAEALLKIPFGRHFVVDSDDQDQWAKAIGDVCNNDRSSRLEECETLRDTYQKKYSWQKQCESLIDKMISITLNDKPEDCGCASEKSTLPHQTEVSNSLCSVSAHFTPGRLPIHIRLSCATFQEVESKDAAQQEEAKHLLMCEMTKHFLEIHAAKVPSEKFNQSLSYYLQGVHDTIIREAGEGSLRIVVECRTLEILERLWDDYNSGHLNEVAEERLLTDEIKKKYEVESIELETTITMENYLACKLSLTDLNRDSTVAENLTDRANGQPLVVQDEGQRELSTVRFTLNYNDCSASPNELHTNQEKGSLCLVSEMLSEEKTSQSSFMELPTYLQHVTVTQDSEPTKERDNSLRFSVECRDLESLECLWSDYRSGRLDWMAEKCLLTDDIKKRLHVESVTLETSILEEDYLACKEHILKSSQNSKKTLMGDDDDTEILLTKGAIQTADTDGLGVQTSIEENSSNSLMGDGDDTEILPTERAIQTANTDNRVTQTSKEAISQLVDQSKTVVPVEDKNETTEEPQIIAGKMIGNRPQGRALSLIGPTRKIPKVNLQEGGWLLKKEEDEALTSSDASSSSDEWHKRYVTLGGGRLNYYKCDKTKTGSSSVSLKRYRVYSTSGKECLPWTFRLHHSKNTDLDFAAQSQREMNEWITRIKTETRKQHTSATNPGKIPTKRGRSVTGIKRLLPQPEAAACSVTTDPPLHASLSTKGWEVGTSDSDSDDKDEGKTSTHQQGPEPFESIPAQELLKDSCSKYGWIRKKESIKSWCNRYIILHKGCMYYYNNPYARTTVGKFSLSGYRLSPAPEKTFFPKFQWTFKLVHLQPGKRAHYFAAYSKQEMNEWMNSIVSDMREYCGTGRQSIIEPNDNAELEYYYPEVEPKFYMEQLATMFGKPQLQPALEAMYCPSPEMGSPQVQRKPLPPQRPAFPSPKSLRGSGFSYTVIPTPVPGQGGASLGTVRQSPDFPRKLGDPPALPARKGKPLGLPKPLPRPFPLAWHTTEPIMRYPSLPCGDQEEEEEGEGYLDIVPDTNPEDVNKKQPALSRGYPDGRSIRRHHNEIVLPSSAVKLDVDKMQVGALLENKLGVYILRRSQKAQSGRALSVWTGDRVRHYMVFQDEKGYALDPDGVRCKTIEKLIKFFYDFTLPRCDVKLTAPYK